MERTDAKFWLLDDKAHWGKRYRGAHDRIKGSLRDVQPGFPNNPSVVVDREVFVQTIKDIAFLCGMLNTINKGWLITFGQFPSLEAAFLRVGKLTAKGVVPKVPANSILSKDEYEFRVNKLVATLEEYMVLYSKMLVRTGYKGSALVCGACGRVIAQ